MDKKNLMPYQAHPINRIIVGQLSPELEELSEETLCGPDGGGMTPSSGCFLCFSIGVLGNAVGGGSIGGNASCFCSYEGNDDE